MKKKETEMLHVIIVSILFIFMTSFSSAQSIIYSTTDGGQWEVPTTWVGGNVPTSSNDVVINGPVIVLNYDSKCLNLTINQGKSLGGTFGYYGQLTVFGNIINNGYIGGGASFDIYGNITNNGIWGEGQFRIRLWGTNQTITCFDNSPISARLMVMDSTCNVFLASNFHLIVNGDNNCDFGNSELFTQGYQFTIDEGQFTNARVTTNDTITFNNTILSSVVINGNYYLDGTTYAFTDNVLKGTATNLGSIINLPGYSTILTIEGDIINYGSLQHSEVHLKKNATNHGIWYNQMTRFVGANEKIIINTPGHPFDGVQMRIEDSATTVKCGSNVEIDVDHFFMSDGKFDCNNNNLRANTVFHQGRIVNINNIIQHGYYESIKIEGNANLYGINNMMFTSLYGTVTNFDTISTAYPQTGNALKVYGELINLGKYYNLYMDLYGNLTNHGSLSNNSLIDVIGDTTQSINLSSPINSEVRFYVNISGTTYQWMKNGTDINGEQGQYLIFPSLQLSNNGIYKCRVTVGGNPVYSREITVNQVTEVQPEKEIVANDFYLYQNYPNPFNPSTRIKYQVSNISHVTLKVYDVLGNEVVALVDEYKNAGTYEIDFNPASSIKNPASGVYFYQLRAGDYLETKKMLMIK